MKLKLIKAPRAGQKDMLCHTDFGTCSVQVGKTVEVSEQMGAAMMAKWGECFKRMADKGSSEVKKPKDPTPSPAAVSPEKVAEIEASKMALAKDYENKKV